LHPNGDLILLESDLSVRDYVNVCFAHIPAAPAVFVYQLPLGAPAPAMPVDHREAAHRYCRPQHQVAINIYKAVCERLERDGKAISQYKSLKYRILVPKFNSLKQQTKERVEACSDLVRGNADSSLLVELYPITASATVRMNALMAEIIDSNADVPAGGSSDVLYVVIVDECHFAPSSTAIPFLHNEIVMSCKNFVALMVSATPYNCVSEYSRIPKGNIIEWSEQINPEDRPNYIGCEHYFRSVAFRMPADALPAELLIHVNGQHTLHASVSRFREFTGCEALAAAITAAVKAAIAAAHADGLLPRTFPLHCTYGGAAGAGTGQGKVFVFALKTKSNAEAVTIQRNGFMGFLGFPVGMDVVLSPQAGLVRAATEPPQLGATTSVANQHLRADSHFSQVFKKIVADCPSLRRLSTKGRAEGNNWLLPLLSDLNLFSYLCDDRLWRRRSRQPAEGMQKQLQGRGTDQE
jgi:hypothetical protein